MQRGKFQLLLILERIRHLSRKVKRLINLPFVTYLLYIGDLKSVINEKTCFFLFN